MILVEPQKDEAPKEGGAEGDAAVINGLAGVATAIATDELLEHTPLEGVAGLAAAAVGGLVVFGLDHTKLGHEIDTVVTPPEGSLVGEDLSSGCLPPTTLPSDFPFGSPFLCDGVAGPISASPEIEASDIPSEPVSPIGGLSDGTADSTAQALTHLHQGSIVIVDPAEPTDTVVADDQALHDTHLPPGTYI